jgi:hypothetical protein
VLVVVVWLCFCIWGYEMMTGVLMQSYHSHIAVPGEASFTRHSNKNVTKLEVESVELAIG